MGDCLDSEQVQAYFSYIKDPVKQVLYSMYSALDGSHLEMISKTKESYVGHIQIPCYS